MNTLLMFDLDQTLVKGHGAGRAAGDRTFLKIFGIDKASDGITMAGRTDPVIFREMLNRRGIPAESAPWEEIYRTYVGLLSEELVHRPGELLPGIPALLDACREAGLYLALGTGNIEPAAALKLQGHGLGKYFPVGGYGLDAPDRDGVIRAGIEKARDHYRARFDAVVVIGDTPHDIACGRANGAYTVGVAMGRFSVAELEEHSPDLAVDDLGDVAGLTRWFLSLEPRNAEPSTSHRGGEVA
ncbi:MAG: haloacid dehalogenase-like hydrolase [Actinobacteria bacterium]|nr:haloacid dehalogenase-like hydrolase [Actinomycetota bacterium]